MRIVVFISLLMFPLLLPARQAETATAINQRLGRGINMGNAFEAPSETAWGNPWQAEYFRLIAEQGFSHVRVPIRWETAERSMSEAPYTIYPAFLERIKTVVDEALKNKLHIIINMHHHESLLADPAGQKARFLAQWDQIANYFQAYSDSLLFEILNEPNGNLTPTLWNTLAADGVREIRKSNPDRTIVIGTAEWGGIGGLSRLQLPDDDNIIVTIHYYNPFAFTHQGADWNETDLPVGVKWYDSEPERETVINEFAAVKTFSEKNKVPIHIGEFGAYSKADIDSRARWTNFLARWFEEQGYSWAYWEFSARFGIYDPAKKTFHTPLVNALLYDPMPEPAQISYTPVYKSDFRSGTDGWSFYTQSTARGSMSARNEKLEVSLTQAGSEGWHGQLTRNGIKLENGKIYRLSFTLSSTASGPFTAYVGRNSDPWNAYSDYNSFAPEIREKEFSYTFTMSGANDPAARIVFDLGKPASTFLFSSIRLETMKITPTAIPTVPVKTGPNIYPNPFEDKIHILNDEGYKELFICSPSGIRLLFSNLHRGKNTINTPGWKPGVYILILRGDGISSNARIVKK